MFCGSDSAIESGPSVVGLTERSQLSSLLADPLIERDIWIREMDT
jgi:hypothetical protein